MSVICPASVRRDDLRVRRPAGHAFNDRVIEVVPTLPQGGTIERQIGTPNVFGIGNGLLDAPCDAKAVGDYTGLTPPFDFGG